MNMRDPTEPVFRCRDCGKGIEDGEKMWSVNIHCETMDDGAMTVHQADCYNYVFCETCASRRDFRHMEIPLKE